MISRMKNPKTTLPLAAILILLIGLLGWKAREVHGLAGQVTTLEKEMASLQLSAASRGVKTEDLGTLSVASLLEDLTQLGRRHLIEMTSIQPGEPQTKEGRIEQAIRLETEGKYRDIGEYLAELEVFQKPVKVTSLKMEVSSSGRGLISASLDLMLYRKGSP